MSNVPGIYVDTEMTASDDGGNSGTIVNPQVGVSMSGVTPDGRAEAVSEAGGAWVGGRKGARTFPSFTFSRLQGGVDDAAWQIMTGQVAGFVSTAAALGDYPYFDFTWSGSYGAETRQWDLEDCVLSGYDVTDGDPSNVESFTITPRGPVTFTGPNGTWTVISSR